jgi:hypothetical protein
MRFRIVIIGTITVRIGVKIATTISIGVRVGILFYELNTLKQGFPDTSKSPKEPIMNEEGGSDGVFVFLTIV